MAEHPGLPMHISSVSIYDPSTAPSGRVRFKDILDLYEDAMSEVPLLRRRLVKIPGNMDFPLWREDPDVDVEFHVRHIALPKPGDWRQFHIQLARLHSRQLDMKRPLWEVYVIEGLNDLEGIPAGSFAILQKLHHAAIDGASVLRLFNFLNRNSPAEPWGLHPSQRPLLRERQPESLLLLWSAGRRYLGRPLKMLGVTKMAFDAFLRVRAGERSGELDKTPEAPPSRFNQEASGQRVVTTRTFDLEEFLHLRRAVPGATVNDLALSICGGALRDYLETAGEAVEPSLVAQVPVDIREPGQQDAEGNVIATIPCICGTDIRDPLERLKAVMHSTSVGKRRMHAMGESMTVEMAEAMGPHLTRAMYNLLFHSSRLGPLSRLLPAPANLVFSNMIGPRQPVYLCGAGLKWGTGLGPIMPTTGLFVTANSTVGQFIFGVSACRKMMPNPQRFSDCLQRSFLATRSALQELADDNAVDTRPRRTRARRQAG